MKILIAGLGSIGRRHLQNLLALGERDILLYRTHQSSLPEEALHAFSTESDLSAALAYRPQAVVISNPTALHLAVAIPAAEAGCSILMEKPISHSLQGVDELKTALQKGGGRLLVGYHFRFHPVLQLAAKLLKEGTIGQPLSVRCQWGEYLPGWHPWEDFHQGYSARADLGGGVVLTLSHPLDYLRMLLGEVESLWAFTSSKGLELAVEDTAEIGLRFVNGVTGSLHLDYLQRPARHNLEIIGSQGSLRWDNQSGCLEVLGTDGETRQVQRPPAGFERNTLFVDEMRHFLAVARGEQSPACSLRDGIQVLKLALAVLQSARQGRLVKLEER